MNSLLCTLIVWGGMHYATPDWMEKQIPDWMWSRYKIHIVPYGSPMPVITDPKTTGLIGFSAGGLDVLKHYNKDYAFVGLIDPSTRVGFIDDIYGPNTVMIYNVSNWGGSNKSMKPVADQINKTGGTAISLSMGHKSMPSYFFKTYFDD
jgi:hypothetical protein